VYAIIPKGGTGPVRALPACYTVYSREGPLDRLATPHDVPCARVLGGASTAGRREGPFSKDLFP
jgi:hypothetical protein